MPNDSSTGGILAPMPDPSPVPTEDNELEDFFTALFAEICGLDEDTDVRPIWQPEPPKIPEPDVDWLALSVTTVPAGFRPDTEQLEDRSVQTNWETVEVRLQAYGPHAQALTTRLREGLYVEQNRAGMYSAGIGLIRFGNPLHVPDKRNERWYNRWNSSVTFSREVRREYPVLPLRVAVAEVVEGSDGENVVAREVTAGTVAEP